MIVDTWVNFIIWPIQTMHYQKDNPSKSPHVWIVWSPPNGVPFHEPCCMLTWVACTICNSSSKWKKQQGPQTYPPTRWCCWPWCRGEQCAANVSSPPFCTNKARLVHLPPPPPEIAGLMIRAYENHWFILVSFAENQTFISGVRQVGYQP